MDFIDACAKRGFLCLVFYWNYLSHAVIYCQPRISLYIFEWSRPAPCVSRDSPPPCATIHICHRARSPFDTYKCERDHTQTRRHIAAACTQLIANTRLEYIVGGDSVVVYFCTFVVNTAHLHHCTRIDAPPNNLYIYILAILSAPGQDRSRGASSLHIFSRSASFV